MTEIKRKLGWPWQVVILVSFLAWLATSVAFNHGPSGIYFGRAAGSLLDPTFLIITLIVAVAARRWWQFLPAAAIIACMYSYYAWSTRSIYFAEEPFSWDAAAGRFLALLVVGSVISLVANAMAKRTRKSTATHAD